MDRVGARHRRVAGGPGRNHRSGGVLIGALLNTWQLDEKMWFSSLLAGGLLGLGVVAMIAYVVAGPDGTAERGTLAASRGLLARDDCGKRSSSLNACCLMRATSTTRR